MKMLCNIMICLITTLWACSDSGENDPSPNIQPLDDQAPVSYVFQQGDGIYQGRLANGVIESTPLYDASAAGYYSGVFGETEDVKMQIDSQGGYIYWTSHSSVNRAPLDGSGPIEVLFDIFENDLYSMRGLAIDPTTNRLFIITRTAFQNHVYVSSLEGGTLTKLYESEGRTYSNDAHMLAYGNNHLYWAEAGDNNNITVFYVVALNLESEQASVLFDTTEGLIKVIGIGVDEQNNKLYIADRKSSSSSGIIYSGNTDGSGGLTPVLEGSPAVYYPVDLKIDNEHGFLYWLNTEKEGDLTLMRANLNDYTPETLTVGRPGYRPSSFGLHIE